MSFSEDAVLEQLRQRSRIGLPGTMQVEPVRAAPVAPDEGPPAPQAVAAPPDAHWWDATVRSVLGVGRPLLVGLAILACSIGVLTYFAVSWIWALKVRWSRRRRRAGGGPERP